MPVLQPLMYNSYFGFREPPFNVTPDPYFFYTNSLYQQALDALFYGIKAKKGFIVITGEVGTGKTTLLRKLMQNLEANVQSVLIVYTKITFNEMLERIVHDLGLTRKTNNSLIIIEELNRYLTEQLKKGHTVSLLIDEAQHLSDDSIEGLRLLSNLETDKEKLLQIVLLGQPELDTKLNNPSLRQLKQRIALRIRLDCLKPIQVEDYVRHRLQVSGYDGPEIFSKEAIEQIWGCSRGIPRLINILCENALLLAYTSDKRVISGAMIDKVADDLQLEPGRKRAIPDGTDMEISGIPSPTEVTDSDNDKENEIKARTTTTALRGDNHEDAFPPEVVSPNFIARMTRALVEAMGPMAPVVVRKQIAILGESPESFPAPRLTELVESVSRAILNERMKTAFEKLMFEEIRAIDGLKTSSGRDVK